MTLGLEPFENSLNSSLTCPQDLETKGLPFRPLPTNGCQNRKTKRSKGRLWASENPEVVLLPNLQRPDFFFVGGSWLSTIKAMKLVPPATRPHASHAKDGTCSLAEEGGNDRLCREALGMFLEPLL